MFLVCSCDSFIDKDSGLADYPVLLVVGTISGTVSMLKVEVTGK